MKVNHAQFEIRNQERNIFCREIAFQIRRIPSTTNSLLYIKNHLWSMHYFSFVMSSQIPIELTL